MSDKTEEVIVDAVENSGGALSKFEDAIVSIVNNPDIDPKAKEVTIRSITSSFLMQESFSGPMPPPNMLAEYNKIIPGSAERILIMAEEQHRHRISMEKNVIPKQVKQSGRGQNFAFILCFILILLAAYCVYAEAYWVAGAIVTLTIISVVGLFITGKHKMDEDLKNKSNESF